MKVLFVGGTGVISSAVSALAISKGIDLYFLNRGSNNNQFSPDVTILKGDIKNKEEVKSLLDGHYFDVVVQWISYTVNDVKGDYEIFNGHTKQFIFISSASAYQKPLPMLPITEDIPLGNIYWDYSENKKLCEEYLLGISNDDFNVTIIRPSHTYNDQKLISQLKSRSHPYTMINRMLQHKPIIIPDDGLSLWTITYNEDFAQAFIDIMGNEQTYHNYYHLTGDKVYTWERINEMICEAVGVTPNIVYIPTEEIIKYFPSFRGELYGDKKDSAIFDNSKIKAVAPNYTSVTDYDNIVKIVVKRLLDNIELQTIDEDFDKRYDALISDYFSNKKYNL